MRRIREAYARFMTGRYGQYGIDELGRCLSIAALVFLVISIILKNNSILYFIGIFLLIFTYYRMFSRNFDKRYKENDAYLNLRYNRGAFMDQYRRRREDLKTHRIYRCPQCKQKVRVPRGKGRISIRCPKCHTEFIKKS